MTEASSMLRSVRARHDRAYLVIFPTLHEVRSDDA